MISFICTSTKKGPVIVTTEEGNAPIFTIELPSTWKDKARICKNGRVRYLLEFDWMTEDKGAALSHPEHLTLPFRITDDLGLERGWLTPIEVNSDLVDTYQLTVDGAVLNLEAYRAMDNWDVIDTVTIYKGDQMAARIQDLGLLDIDQVRVGSYTNDYIGELSILAALFFFRSNAMLL